ncbi:YfbM family protein [Solirubrobacter taibaiensis]|nr:YfbM family protein [Solirubrobacter taibaiensis]
MLGASFLLTADQLAELRGCPDDEAREAWLMALEEAVPDDRWFQFDKAWEPIHLALGDGELVIQDGPPRAHAVFGSEPLMEDEETDTFAGLLPADEVANVVAELEPLDEAWVREHVDDDFDYVWENFDGLRAFLARARDEDAAVVFTVTG